MATRSEHFYLTLAALYAIQADLSMSCLGCGRSIKQNAFWFLNDLKLPMTITLGAIQARLKCARCESREVDVKVDVRVLFRPTQ